MLLVSFVVATTSAACHEDQPACFVGEFAGCSCRPGVTGYQVCLPSEEGYGTCVCDGKTPGIDAGRAGTVGAPDAGPGSPRDGVADADADLDVEAGS